MTRRIEMRGHDFEGADLILTKEALDFVADLHQRFGARRKQLLADRAAWQKQVDLGKLPDFPSETSWVRDAYWQVAPIPEILKKRSVEITGPASSRKMMINALNSGADVYMADSEDSDAPTWRNMVQGQINLRDANRGSLTHSEKGKDYKLAERTAVLMYRPRGWHLEEAHLLVDGEPMSASLFDFGMYFWHNAEALYAGPGGVFLYLPKMEHYQEARLWNDVISWSEDRMQMGRGFVRATVLLETFPAAFEMDEILYELREHVLGLNCGRWDYIFSAIKVLRLYPDFVLPDRSRLTMDKEFLASYASLLVKTCYRRGAQPIGGMSAFIPSKDEETNLQNQSRVRADKARERKLRFIGAWVPHPGYVPLVKEIFEIPVDEESLVDLDSISVAAKDLLSLPIGEVTYDGFLANIRVGLEYLKSWLAGIGCVPINNLMEDLATAEISRMQIWQWAKHGVKVQLPSDGKWAINRKLVWDTICDEMERIRPTGPDLVFYEWAAALFLTSATSDECQNFLSIDAYRQLLGLEKAPVA